MFLGKNLTIYGALAVVFMAIGAYLGVKAHTWLYRDEPAVSQQQDEQKTITTTITQKADGSSTTSIVEKSNKKSQSTQPAGKPQPKYKAGFVASKPVGDLKATASYTVTAGYRVVDKIWLDAQYNIDTKSVGAGISVQF